MDSVPLPAFKKKLFEHKKQLVIIAAVFIFALIFFTFSWDWFRPMLTHYAIEKSGRDIKIGHMDVAFSGFLNPTIQFEDIYIPNASWSDKRPLINAKRIAFSFNARQFLSNSDTKIVHISMSDSEVNLERLRGGLRNWRLLKPDYKGPGKYLLLSLTAQRSVINVKNHAFDLNLAVKIEPNVQNPVTQNNVKSADSANSNSTSKVISKADSLNSDLTKNISKTSLPNKITFSGDFLNSPFEGVLFSESRMTFQQTRQFFKVDGYLNQEKNTISVHGKLADIAKNPMIDADIESTGKIFSIINLIKSSELTGKDAFSFSTHVFRKDNQYKLNQFEGKINSSDIKGDIAYVYDENKPQLSGKIFSQSIDFKELVGFFTKIKKVNSSSYRSFSLVENLKKSDMDVAFNIQHVNNLQPVALSGLNLAANGHAGKFDVKINDARLNGGKLTGKATADFNQELSKTGLARLDMQIALNQLQMARLLSSTNLDDKLSAPLSIKANLHAAGDSFASMTKNLSGDADVTIGKGAISNNLDAKLGLDLGKLFWLTLRGDKNIALNCGQLGLDIKQGVATSHTFWVNTAQTIVEGKGRIDLNNQQVNVLIDPQPKDPGLFTVSKSIQLSGQLGGDLTIKTTDSQLKKSAQNASTYACKSL